MPLTPFSVSPNPNALYLTAQIRTALFRVRSAIDHRQGLAAILGDVGIGKSTLLRYLHAEYAARDDVRTVLIPTCQFPSPMALARRICEGFDVAPKRSLIAQQSAFEQFLIEQYESGRNVVLFLDETQFMDGAQLDFIRITLNFETATEKLCNLVIAGQLDLRDRLLSKRHKPLLSRVWAPCLLNPLTADEVRAMLELRCDLAGISWPFEPDALEAIYTQSAGVPRDALRIAEATYQMGHALDQPRLSRAMVAAVIESAQLKAAVNA